MRNLPAILAGAVFLIWPAFFNGYPIVFSDTGGFLEQALMPDMGWDKPWIYGPFLTPFHARLTLWPAILAQGLILSALLWLTLIAIARPANHPAPRATHLAICAALAALTAAPWFAATLMPDIFAPITVLGLFLLATPLAPAALTFVALITTIAIATHLAHLILAATCLATLSLLHWRLLWRQTAPLIAALALIATTNLVGAGIPAISPYGSVFALARLVADGPAATTIQRRCPAANWHLCAWKDRLPADSDDFLWDPNGPVWAWGYGPIRLAPEATTILRDTLMNEPLAVLQAITRNTIIQLTEVAIGDTLTPDHLDVAVSLRLAAYFPPAELARFQASRQARGQLPALAKTLNPIYLAALIAGTLATIIIAITQRRQNHRRNRPLATLAALTLVALVANAASTGALSHPHDRYEARIAWLVVLVPALYAVTRRQRLPSRTAPPRPRSATGDSSAG